MATTVKLPWGLGELPLPEMPAPLVEATSNLRPAQLAFLLLGVAVYVRFGLRLLAYLWVYAIRPGLNPKKRFGPYCVVTGATDGIGKAYAVALAKKGAWWGRVGWRGGWVGVLADPSHLLGPSSLTHPRVHPACLPPHLTPTHPRQASTW